MRSGTLLLLACTLVQGEDAPPPFTWDSREQHLDREGAVVASQGFSGRFEGRLLMGDAFRWDQEGDHLWVSGRVLYVMPGVRVEADRLGLHPRAHTGEAWNVRAWIEQGERRARISAARLRIDPDRLVFEDVRMDGGHGAVAELTTSRVVVDRFDPPREDHDGIRRYIAGIGVSQPTISLAQVPVLWLPYLYRDFTFDYPWTRVEAGHGKRQGDWGRYRIGLNLPGPWATRWEPEARIERGSHGGTGWGGSLGWRLGALGDGRALWYGMPEETVYAPPADTAEVQRRSSHALDLEHRADAAPWGGAAALSARWTDLPPPDPGTPAGVRDERYRADYLREDLDHRPFARRGAEAAWTLPAGTVVLDTWRRPAAEWADSERWLGVQAMIPRTRLLGPLHAGADVWSEDLHRPWAGIEAVRSSGDAGLSAAGWLGGIGLDASAGVRALRYDDGLIAGTRPDAAMRHVGFADAGIRLRLAGDFDDLHHTLVPRLGIELTSAGRGDALPAYGFGDPRDVLAEDRRFATTGLETSLTAPAAGRTLFQASVVARWALRDADRRFTDAAGTVRTAPGSLAEVAGSASGDPHPRVSVVGSATYDARLEAFTGADANALLRLHPHLALRHVVSLATPPGGTDPGWRHQPTATVTGFRYRLDVGTVLRPGGADIDGWSVMLTRHLVDGRLQLSWDFIRDERGAVYDRRIGLGFQLGSGGAPKADERRADDVRSFTAR